MGAPEQTGYRLLVKNVSLIVGPGEHLLITGPNGAGKTSLLRVLAGLWEPIEGHVSTPKAEKYDGGKVMMWLPQRPYLLQGSLRDQVVYPNIALAERARRGKTKRVDANAVADEDERVKQCLRAAGLGKFVDGGVPGVSLDTRHLEWNDVLSGGERQRIGFARLFYHSPPFAILDEATSAINPDEEGQLYERVIEQGTTVVSIAHRLELRKFHRKELKLAGDGSGGWELHKNEAKPGSRGGDDKWKLVDKK